MSIACYSCILDGPSVNIHCKKRSIFEYWGNLMANLKKMLLVTRSLELLQLRITLRVSNHR